MIKRNIHLIILLSILMSISIYAQRFIPLWNNNMPNSRGIEIKDSIANERIYRVSKPGIYEFKTPDSQNKKAAVLVIPGGGYVRLAYEVGGFQLAKWLNTLGINAFVLIHRLPQSPDVIESYKAPLQDAQRAMRYIRAHANEYGIDTNKIGVMGGSAGGHLAACLSTIKDDWSKVNDSLDVYSFKPNFTILISPVITMELPYAHKGSRDNLLGENPSEFLIKKFSCEQQVDSTTPPAFIVHAMDDNGVNCMNSIFYFTALKKNGKENKSSLHIYAGGKHNIGLRYNPLSTNTWSELAELWLKEISILP
ncbi:MAG: alpha/beta hydrolase [Melioribacteraceae bacterium]